MDFHRYELLGNEAIAYGEIGGQKIAVKTYSREDEVDFAKYSYTINTSKALYFNLDNEERIS